MATLLSDSGSKYTGMHAKGVTLICIIKCMYLRCLRVSFRAHVSMHSCGAYDIISIPTYIRTCAAYAHAQTHACTCLSVGICACM